MLPSSRDTWLELLNNVMHLMSEEGWLGSMSSQTPNLVSRAR
jgi:hypothetical protein